MVIMQFLYTVLTVLKKLCRVSMAIHSIQITFGAKLGSCFVSCKEVRLVTHAKN